MKTKLLLILSLVLTVCEMSAQVTLPYHEPFNYIVDEELVSAAANLGDWSSDFTTNDGSDPEIVAQPTWTLPTGLPAASGNAVIFEGGSDDPVIVFPAQGDTGFIYSSFVFRVEDQSAVTATDGAYIYSFGKVNSDNDAYNYASTVYIKKIVDGVNDDTFNIGVGETNSRSRAEYSATAYSINTDYFIVISYDIENEVSRIWINPTSVSATEPTADVISTDTTTGSRDDIVVVRLSLEANSRTPRTIIDEIRIANTWADVVSVVAPVLSISENELDKSFKIYPNPAKDYIQIESNDVKISSVEMYNIVGKKIISEKSLINNKLNISSLSSGIYLLKVNAEGRSLNKKIVVE